MRPTIYIGLGGTGIRAIAQTKKMYEDVYGVGKIPPCIAFLAIDTDSSILEDKTLATSIEEDFVCCEADRQSVLNYIEKGNCSNWMFHNNYKLAANQVRTTGRFFAEYMLKTIDATLQQCWQQVLHYSNMEIDCDRATFHVVTSLVGATGAGLFLNVAELISHKYGKRAKVYGYGVLHGVFRTQDPYGAHTPKVRVNAYASVLDLDYLMHASRYNPIKLEINGREREFVRPIFDEFFVIDNVTESGLVLSDIGQVCESVATGLFVSTAMVPGVLHADMSTCSWVHGEYDVLQKRGWVKTLGVYKIVYKGDDLAKNYGCKAAIELIRKMRQEGAEAQKLAQQWTEEAGVREDGEPYNMLIDSIVEPKTIERLRIPALGLFRTIDEIKSDVANYIGDMSDMPSDACIKEMMEEKKQSLVAKVKQLLSQEYGVGNSRIFLDSLIRLCEKYRLEMINEADQLNITLEGKSALLEKAIKEYEEYCDRLFKTKSGKEERLETVSKFAKDIRKINYEIKRREIARDIFVYLVRETIELRNRIGLLDEQLVILSEDFSQNLTTLQNCTTSSVIEYDLSADERLNMTLKDDVILVSLLASLPASLLDIDIETQLRPAIEKYTASLPQAARYREKSIIDVINNLDDNAYAQLKDAIGTKASCLLKINDRGLVSRYKDISPSDMMIRYNYIIKYFQREDKYDGDAQILRDDCFMRRREFNRMCESDIDISRQQIYVLKINNAVIPYCIDAFDKDVVEEYEKVVQEGSWNPHFDKNIYEQMRAQNFSLKPKYSENNEPHKA